MRKRKAVKYEIRLIGLTASADGTLSIVDIVETSRRNAYWFVSNFRRNPEITHIAACAPADSCTAPFEPRRLP